MKFASHFWIYRSPPVLILRTGRTVRDTLRFIPGREMRRVLTVGTFLTERAGKTAQEPREVRDVHNGDQEVRREVSTLRIIEHERKRERKVPLCAEVSIPKVIQ